MSDPTDPTLLNIGTHAGVGGLAAAITTAIARIFAGRERDEEVKAKQEVATRLAVIDEKLGHVQSALDKVGDVGERVALLERDVKALHERLDGERGKRARR